MDVQNKIFEQVSNHEVVLYMKGDAATAAVRLFVAGGGDSEAL